MVIAEPVNTPAAWSERARTIPEPWAACGWSLESQEARFDRVLFALDPKPGESMLDYGCGTGDLADCLALSFEYTGYDWAEGMVERAREEHPDRRFVTAHPTGSFDLVAVIGVFNLPGSKQDAFHAVRHLWDTTGCRALAFSAYAGSDPNCLHYTDQDLVRLGAQLAYGTTVERILPNDLLMVARR